MRFDYDFALYKKHLENIEFVPSVRYTMGNVFVIANYQRGFRRKEDFLGEVFRIKPIFVANALPLEIITIDLDFKLEAFTRENFLTVKEKADRIASVLASTIPVEDVKYRFSGRGLHIRAKTPIFDEILEKAKKKGILLTDNPKKLVLEYVLKGLRKKITDKSLLQYIDPSIASSNKIFRSLYSLNDKSFLPVVDLDPNDESQFSLEYITTRLGEPRHYEVTLYKRMPVREGKYYVRRSIAEVDEYELLRLLFKYNYFIKAIEEI